jgi:hypothetical protein
MALSRDVASVARMSRKDEMFHAASPGQGMAGRVTVLAPRLGVGYADPN